MATSGSTSVTVTSWNTLKFSWSVSSQSTANNTSTISWKLELIAGGSGRIDSSASKTWSVTVNGTKYSGNNTINIAANATKTLASGTTTITHTSNGTKTFSYSFSQQFSITFSGSSIGTKSGSGSGTLPTIARASSLTASNGTLNAEQTLTITRADSSFKHKITYTCGSASGYAAGSSSAFTTATSISWTPPLSLASQNTAGTSVTVSLILKTYTSAGAEIGSVTKTISCAIPASVKPSCSLAVTDPTGYFDAYGAYIKGLSKFKVTVTPSLAYGSAIATYSITANGAKYTAASFTTGVLTSSGTLSISATVKDKRGRSGSASVSRTVLNYTEPVIIKLAVQRCNEDGSANDQGEFVKATFSAAVTNLNNKNKAAYVLKYKKSTESSFTEVGLDGYANQYSVTDAVYIFPADSGSSYNVELSVTDNFKTTRRTTSASTGFTLMNWKADGTGIGIGKIAEESNLFDVALPARFLGAVSGNVSGLNKLPQVPANSDLNNYMDTGCWAVYSNADAASIANMPVARAGRLEVISATGEGIRLSQWSYLRQRFTPYNMDNAVWERDITRSADNVWRYYEWFRSSLNDTASRKVYHEQKVLWGSDLTSGMYMTNGHTATLTEKISEQANGVELVFCYYNGTNDTHWAWQTFFVSKKLVALEPGGGHVFRLANGKFGSVGTKYLYINDDRIVGHADNSLTGAGSGITYANNKFVLRYVIGV